MIAVHVEHGRVAVRDIRRPRRSDGFALIRLLLGGICNTDLELQRGYYGFSGIPGHEFVGEVVEANDSRLVGKRVVGEINLGCGQCSWCSEGMSRHCPKRTVLGIVRHAGAFREFLTLPETNLHIVPDVIPSEAAVFVEPLAAAGEILDQASIPEGAAVAVLGDGKLGLLIAQVLCANLRKAHLYGRHRKKLRIAERAGAATIIVGKNVPIGKYDWVVEATGSQNGLETAVRMTRPRGTVFLKSTVHGLVRVDTAPVVVNEITLIGSRCGRFEPALDLLKSGRINVRDMISETMSLAHAPRAFAAARKRGMLKVLLAAD
jgi:threonine dehydrogenase-like Zn-dependent dehydrogenase